MKNSGNEAKKYLKTKEVTLLMLQNMCVFACNSAQFEHQKEQKQRS
jgi:hypothetical protein